MSLTAIADEINAIYSNVENEHMRTALLLAQARSKFELDSKGKQLSDAKINSGFIKWAEGNTPYKQRAVYTYLAVESKIATVAKTVEKAVPFSVLRELSSPKVDKKTVDTVLRKFGNKVKPTTAEVNKIIKDAAPAVEKKADRVIPDFAIRSIRKGEFVAKEAFLLNVTKESTAETIRILARYWKQKYHPDKDGGDADIFDRIVKAEKTLLAERGEE